LTLEEVANGVEKVKVKRKVQAPGVSYKTCSTCNGQGQVMRVTNTILGRMQSASTCPTGGSGQILDKSLWGWFSRYDRWRWNGFYQNSCWCSRRMQLKNKGNDAPGKCARRFNCSYRRVRAWILKREGENLHDLYISFLKQFLVFQKILKP
jgi:molecular chaperone DnaJ